MSYLGSEAQSRPAAAVRTWPAWATRAGWTLVGAGILIRIIHYAMGRGLWIDEAALALNIVNRPWAELLKPLAEGQGAPIGFLLAVKACVQVLGDNEYALRLVPMLAGVVAVPLFALLARRCLPCGAALCAIALFAGADRLVYYSAELKQYALDVTFALGILLLGFRLMEAFSTSRLLALVVLGTVATWFSHPAVFILAGVGCVVFVAEAVPAGRQRMGLVAAGACVWTISFAVQYWWFLKPLIGTSELQEYWKGAFLPLGPGIIKWLPRTFYDALKDPVGVVVPAIGAVVLALGLLHLLQTRMRVLAMLILPIVFALAASALEKYPFNRRLILFIVPSMLVTVGAGMEYLWHCATRNRPLVMAAIGAMLIVPSVASAMSSSLEKEEVRPVFRHVAAGWREHDTLYLYYSTRLPFEYYGQRCGLGNVNPIVGVQSRGNPAGYFADLDQLRGRPRVWVVFSHVLRWGGANEENLLLTYLDHLGERLDEFQSADASAYLYDLSAPR